jgi:hypothetical protein
VFIGAGMSANYCKQRSSAVERQLTFGEVGYDAAMIDPTALPQNISRNLRIDWAGFSIPYGYTARARVMAPISHTSDAG